MEKSPKMERPTELKENYEKYFLDPIQQKEIYSFIKTMEPKFLSFLNKKKISIDYTANENPNEN